MRILLVSVAALCPSLAAGQSVGATYCGPAPLNSTGQPAQIAADGSTEAGGQPLTLTASDLPQNQFSYFLVSQTQGFVSGPTGSQGNLCLGGTIGRYTDFAASSGSAGAVTLEVDTLALPTTPVAAIQAGETWNFQAWYRDANPTPTSNFTPGLAITFDAGEPLVAAFSADEVIGSASFSVQFQDESTGGASSWLWDFGDGATSTEQSPAHLYTARGTYDVRLTVNGSTEMFQPAFITVVQGFDDVWADLQSCTTCHSASGFAGLDFPDADTAYTELVGVPSACDGVTPRVQPGNLEQSLLYRKLAGTQDCGLPMPLSGGFDGDMAILADWILEGAHR